MPKIGSLHRFLPQALIGIVLLCLAVAYDGWKTSATIPYSFRFIPPTSEVYLVAHPLKGILSDAQSHPIFSAIAKTSEWSDFAQLSFALHCLNLLDQANLPDYGISGDAEVAIAGVGSNINDYALSFSTPTRPHLEAFFNALATPSTIITLFAADRIRRPRLIRLTQISTHSARLCSMDGTPISVSKLKSPLDSQWNDKSNRLEARILAAWDGIEENPSIRVSCTAEYDNGEELACGCEISSWDSSPNKSSPCPSLQELAWRPLHRFKIKSHDHEMPAAKIEPLIILINQRVDGYVVYPESEIAVVTPTPSGAQAAADRENNFVTYRGDDTFQEVLHRVRGAYRGGQSEIFGAMRLPALPISGRIHFGFALSTDRITGSVIVPWQSLGSSILSRVSDRPALPSGRASAPLRDRIELNINDPALGQYIRYFQDYFPRQASAFRECLRTFFGNYAASIEELMEFREMEQFRLVIQRIRDGVPDVVMAVKMPSGRANQIITKQRAQFREARDKTILLSAAVEFIIDHGGARPKDIGELMPYLKKESGALWDHFVIRPIDPPALSDTSEGCPRDVTAHKPTVTADKPTVSIQRMTPLSASDFAPDEYEERRGGRLFMYLAPPVTANDIHYRIANMPIRGLNLSELSKNKFRLATYFDRDKDMLLIGTDVESLVDWLSRDDALRATDWQQEDSKMILRGTPRIFADAALMNPSKDLGAEVDGILRALQGYSQLEIKVDPGAHGRTLVGTLDLRR